MSIEDKDENLHKDYEAEGAQADQEESLSLDTGRPAVASAPAKIMIFVVTGLVVIAIVVKALFFPSEGPVAENKIKKIPEKVAAGSGPLKSGSISPGELPTPPTPEPINPSYSSADSSRPLMPPTPGGGNNNLLSKLPPPPSLPNTQVTLPSISMTPPAAAMTNAPPIIGAPPALITAPALKSGESKAPPPPPPGLAAPAMPDVKTSMPKDEAATKRIAAESTLINNAGSGSTGSGANDSKSKGNSTFIGNKDENSAFAQAVTAGETAAPVKAEKINNLQNVIAQGKIIYAVLETAINSDLPGTLRAVISHDVYAEAGRTILIPKGSRLIGTYNTAIKRGQSRVFIIWQRVIRPDGITMSVNSPAVDNLGRAGILGDVDNKYLDMFSTAILTSSLDIGIAAIGQALFGDDQSSTTTNSGTGGTTTTSSATGTAMQQAVSSIGEVGKQIVGTTIAIAPTISIDQGTPVSIFVNKELEFPSLSFGPLD